MDRTGLTLTHSGILLLTFIRTVSCLRCQICQYYKLESSLKSVVTFVQDYDNADCMQKPKMDNFSIDCFQAPDSECLKITGKFKLHQEVTKEVGKVEFVIRSCSYTAEPQDCRSFPNETNDAPAIVQLFVKSVESSGDYYISDFSGTECMCDVNNCNASERLTNRYYVISSLMLFTMFATFNS